MAICTGFFKSFSEFDHYSEENESLIAAMNIRQYTDLFDDKNISQDDLDRALNLGYNWITIEVVTSVTGRIITAFCLVILLSTLTFEMPVVRRVKTQGEITVRTITRAKRHDEATAIYRA